MTLSQSTQNVILITDNRPAGFSDKWASDKPSAAMVALSEGLKKAYQSFLKYNLFPFCELQEHTGIVGFQRTTFWWRHILYNHKNILLLGSSPSTGINPLYQHLISPPLYRESNIYSLRSKGRKIVPYLGFVCPKK